MLYLVKTTLMKKLDAKAVFESIEGDFLPSASQRLLHDIIAEQIQKQGLESDLDLAFELAEPLIETVRDLIFARQASAQQAGEIWVVEMCGTEDEYVRGSSSHDGSLPMAEQRVRSNREHAEEIKVELVKLTPLDFESACTSILRIMGCLDPQTSPSRDDGGIDFYGKLELKGRLDNKSPYGGFDTRAGLWLIGQAKNYPIRPIQTAHIRELVGSVELARTGGAIHTWKGLRLRPFDAVIQLLFTTGSFSSGSRRLLESSGIISMTGDQLAVFVADAGIGIDAETGSFDATSFRLQLVG